MLAGWQPGPQSPQLALLRMCDGAHKLYTVGTLVDGELSHRPLLWAPGSPLGRPRLAVLCTDHSQARAPTRCPLPSELWRPAGCLLIRRCKQPGNRCERHVFIRSVGCEVVLVSDGAAEFAWWSPDSESLATAGRGSEGNQVRLLLHSVVSGRCRSVDLLLSAPTSVLMADAMAWSPDSRLVLSLLSLLPSNKRTMIAAFVDAESAAVSTQQLHLPGAGASLVWGASGYVAFACMDVSQESCMVCVCLAAGRPQRLQVLHRLQTGSVITSLSCSASGLLCSWVDIGNYAWSSGIPLIYTVGGRSAAIVVCELQTGRTRAVAQLLSSPFQWASVGGRFSRFLGSQNVAVVRWQADGQILVVWEPNNRGWRNAWQLTF